MPAPAVDTFISVPAFDSIVDRARLLARLGLRTETQLEFARLADLKGDTMTVEQLLAAADALRRADRAADAIQLARRALAEELRRTRAPIVYSIP